MSILTLTVQILQKHPLCDHCLGRQFGNLLSGVSNQLRGNSLRNTLALAADMGRKDKEEFWFGILEKLAAQGFQPAKEGLGRDGIEIESTEEIKCSICDGIFTKKSIERKITEAVRKATKYEFSNFLVGSIPRPEMLEKEDELRAAFSLKYGESLKAEINREYGKALLKTLSSSREVEVNFDRPDIVFTFDFINHQVQVRSHPLFVGGRYKKHKRGIPQSKWLCRSCQGDGCGDCNFLGRRYSTSVEELVTPHVCKAAEGKEAKFHASGREDVDALMLGDGRPFVIEIRQPYRRTLNLEKLAQMINFAANKRIEVELEGYKSRSDMINLKSRSQQMTKRYRAIVALEKIPHHLDEDFVNKTALSFKEQVIAQETPTRVVHRRTDKIRYRTVLEMVITILDEEKLNVLVHCEGGLYVKELISGDDGRTSPSLSERLGIPAKVLDLDVLEVNSPRNIHRAAEERREYEEC